MQTTKLHLAMSHQKYHIAFIMSEQFHLQLYHKLAQMQNGMLFKAILQKEITITASYFSELSWLTLHYERSRQTLWGTSLVRSKCFKLYIAKVCEYANKKSFVNLEN